MGSEDEREGEDRWWLGWRGLRVRQVEASGQGSIVHIGERSELTLPAQGFTLRSASHADDAPTEADAVTADLAGDTVLSCVAFKTGALRVVFQSGLRLDIQGQAWSAVGESGRSWVSLPDGLSTTASGTT